MEITGIMLGVLFAIVLSNIMSSLFPMLPLPLIQITFGCLMSLTMLEQALELEPEIFMILVIAPLLFREADETDLFRLWEMKKAVILMAFIVVFITVFAIGFSVSLLVPAIPLAACFALGAILGPTDVVAVTSLSSRISMNDRLHNILLGEGLVNDASGITAFRFAVAAMLTGGFSLRGAVVDLLIVSAGGLIIGLLLSEVERRVVKMLKKLSIKNMGAYMLIELMMPFLCYMAAEVVGVSGVLAAVAAGIRQTPKMRKADLMEAEMGIAKQATWDMLTFTLNSFVFLLLGLQLPQIVKHIWDNPEYTHAFLIISAVLVTLILMVVRFVSVLILVNDAIGESLREKLKNSLLLTLSGVKGAVSLATAFSLPAITVFQERPLLLFITAGAIILSLLMALFLLPLVADSAEQTGSENMIRVEILKEVIDQLEQEGGAEDPVILNCRARIKDLELAGRNKSDRRKLRALMIFMYRTELAALKSMLKREEISREIYQAARKLVFFMYRNELWEAALSLDLDFMFMKLLRRSGGDLHESVQEQLHGLDEIFSANAVLLTDALNGERGKYADDLIDRMIQERDAVSGRMKKGFAARSVRARLNPDYEEQLLRGFYVERRVIHQFLEDGRIMLSLANKLRSDVSMLELHVLSGGHGEFLLDVKSLIENRKARKRRFRKRKGQ